MASEHVSYVRRRHPDRRGPYRHPAVPGAASPRGTAPLAERVAELGLAGLDPAGQGDVADPAGGDEQDYVDCARELSVLIGELVPRLG